MYFDQRPKLASYMLYGHDVSGVDRVVLGALFERASYDHGPTQAYSSGRSSSDSNLDKTTITPAPSSLLISGSNEPETSL